jgi:hypothetical membrane protein
MTHLIRNFTYTHAKRSIALRIFAWAGIVAPFLYIVVYTLAGFLNPSYSPLLEPISNLGAVGPYPWIQNMNFVLTGLLFLLFAIGFFQQMHSMMRQATLVASTFFLIVAGVGMVIVGFFHTDIPGFPPITFHGLLHDILFFVIFISLEVAVFTIGGSLRKIAGWHGYGWYSTFTGVATIALFVLLAIMNNNMAGLFQRVFEVVPFAWYTVMGCRFLMLERAKTTLPEEKR